MKYCTLLQKTTRKPLLASLAFLFCLLAFRPLSAAAAATTARKLSLDYEISMKGEPIGRMKVTRTPVVTDNRDAIKELKKTLMHTGSRSRLESMEQAEFRRGGTLLSYDADIKEKDTYRIKARLKDGSVSIKFFENGVEAYATSIKTEDIDFTSLYLPLDALKPGAKSYSVLDLGNLETESTSVRRLGKGNISVKGRKLACTIVLLKAGAMETRRWLIRDENGYWLPVREIVHTESGDFTTELKEYRILD